MAKCQRKALFSALKLCVQRYKIKACSFTVEGLPFVTTKQSNPTLDLSLERYPT